MSSEDSRDRAYFGVFLTRRVAGMEIAVVQKIRTRRRVERIPWFATSYGASGVIYAISKTCEREKHSGRFSMRMTIQIE